MIRFLIALGYLLMSVPVFAAEYKVVRVVDGDTVYIDFNNNGIADKDERVRLNGIDAFETHVDTHLESQMKTFGLSREEIITLGYIGMEFARERLQGKFVDVEFTAEKLNDKYNRPLVSIKYDKNKSYEQEILKCGYASVYRLSNRALELLKYEKSDKIIRNAQRVNEYDLRYYNPRTGEYYHITSPEAQNHENRLINIKGVIPK